MNGHVIVMKKTFFLILLAAALVHVADSVGYKMKIKIKE